MKLREEEFYEQYHQHGGTTIIPTEIFNELYDDATEEIERLNKDLKDACEVIERLKEDKKKAIEIYENRNSIKYKKKRFMEDKSISDLMYEVLKGSDKE